MTKTVPKTNNIDYICKGCKRAVNQSICLRQGLSVKCMSYVCDNWERNPCNAYNIFHYTYDRLREEGMINDQNSISP